MAPIQPAEPEPSTRLLSALRRMDRQERLVAAARQLRRRLPGDSDYGDPLSLGGSEPAQLLGQRVAAHKVERPSAARELGLTAVQVWQALSEAQGRGQGDQELAILFTDLVEYSSWALEAGDTMAIELLRGVGQAIEPPITARGGKIVKRLGDGLMAVFADTGDAVEAALEASEAVGTVEIQGHRPAMRAGIHVGRPRHLGGDYLGVDVNVAARVAAAAGPGEVLISDAARERVDRDDLKLKRQWLFKAKGAPRDLKVYSVSG